MKTILIYGVVIMLLCFVCIYNLVNYIRYYGQFKAFNENIESWSKNIDSSVREAIIVQSEILLEDLDKKVELPKEEENNNLNKDEEDE